MFTIGLMMKLRPGAYAKYKEAHDNIWPDLAKGMTENKIDMAIYHHDGRLFLFAAAPTEEHWKRSRQDPVLKPWSDEMAKLLESDAAGNIQFEHLPKAFGFGNFK